MTAKAGSEGEMFVCMDVVWNYLRTKKTPDGCHLQFSNLSRIALLVLAIPHSNAQEEWVFRQQDTPTVQSGSGANPVKYNNDQNAGG